MYGNGEPYTGSSIEDSLIGKRLLTGPHPHKYVGAFVVSDQARGTEIRKRLLSEWRQPFQGVLNGFDGNFLNVAWVLKRMLDGLATMRGGSHPMTYSGPWVKAVW